MLYMLIRDHQKLTLTLLHLTVSSPLYFYMWRVDCMTVDKFTDTPSQCERANTVMPW